jgi:serine palmitoyltransferase
MGYKINLHFRFIKATEIDLLVGSLATGLCATGGFCAGTRHVVDHQVCRSVVLPLTFCSHMNCLKRINGTSFVFSAAMPALLAVSASRGIQILTDNPSMLSKLNENIHLVRSILDKVEGIHISSHPASPLIHIQLPVPAEPRSPLITTPSFVTTPRSPKNPNLNLNSLPRISNPQSVLPGQPLQFDVEAEERILQDIVDEALVQGVLITRAKRLRGQEVVEPRPAIKLAVTSALSKKDIEKATLVVKSAIGKVLSRRRKLAI